MPSIPIRLKRLLWLLCISGGLLALVCIVQRLDGTPKLLWIFERERFGSSTRAFGPFGYRGNGASYLNMILPLSFGFLMWMIEFARSVRMKTGRKSGESHLILIPAICVLVAAPFVSLSRGGFVVLGFMLIAVIFKILLTPDTLKSRQRTGLVILLVTGIGLSCCIGWKPLLKRLPSINPWIKTNITTPNYQEKIKYVGTFSYPPDQNHILFQISDSKSVDFRKSLFRVQLRRDGRLILLLWDKQNKSSVQTTYTNLTNAFGSGKVTLELLRNSQGIKLIANKKQLQGNVKTFGVKPPPWNYPVIPNAIYIGQKWDFEKDASGLTTHLLSIDPINSEPSLDHNKKGILWNVDDPFNVMTILSKMSSRELIYQDSLRMAKDFRMLGCGSGAWATVYFLYHDADEAWDAWVHCDWLEYWINFGFFGTFPGFALLILTSISFKAKSGITSHTWMRTALNLAITGCLLHALFDFPLQVISIMHLFIILCAVKFAIRRS